jgi:hypothetical protein
VTIEAPFVGEGREAASSDREGTEQQKEEENDRHLSPLDE